MKNKTDDLRIINTQELMSPQEIIDSISPTDKGLATIVNTRMDIKNILNKSLNKFMIVVGPCSIHDIEAALEYADRLKRLSSSLSDNCLIIMRVYFEKPRTTIGWKGLINDPNLDDSYDVNKGLREARKILLNINEIGLPAATEYLDIITPQYISDLISWGAIGARTTESQVHRELASGLSCPVGFKNSTNGSIQVAIDAIGSASQPHIFLSITKEGKSAIFNSSGNKDCHVILRGGKIPNFESKFIKETSNLLSNSGNPSSLMVDMSHGNSQKQFKKQLLVNKDIADQIASGERSIFGVMIESNLVEGNQSIGPKESLTYGQSITDACVNWEDTEIMLNLLSSAVKSRRKNLEETA